jgi:hypothetical protein
MQTWFTMKELQEVANENNKSICAWRPASLPKTDGPCKWAIDVNGKISDYANKKRHGWYETDPWLDEKTHRHRILIRPNNGGGL